MNAVSMAAVAWVALLCAQDRATDAPPVLASIADAGVETRWLLPNSILDRADCHVKLAADLLTKTFEAQEIDGRFGAAKQFGDVVRIAREARAGGTSCEDVLGEVADQRPEMVAAYGDWLDALLEDDGLLDPEWTPDDDRDDDGIRIGKRMEFVDADGAPWSTLDGDRTLVQGATLVFADLATIKAVERDYAAYRSRAGARYETIALKPASWRTGEAKDVGAFTLHHMTFRADLPFPFTTYACDLAVLDRIDASGAGTRLRCDVYSTSADFHWLAGADVYLPVTTSAGEPVAWLLVRVFGFDLDDVPDGNGDREAGVRAGLGNLKRDAERLARAAKPGPASVTSPADLLTADAKK